MLLEAVDHTFQCLTLRQIGVLVWRKYAGFVASYDGFEEPIVHLSNDFCVS